VFDVLLVEQAVEMFGLSDMWSRDRFRFWDLCL